MSWLGAGECCNIQYPSQSHLKIKSHEILFSYNFSVAQLFWNYTVMLSTKWLGKWHGCYGWLRYSNRSQDVMSLPHHATKSCHWCGSLTKYGCRLRWSAQMVIAFNRSQRNVMKIIKGYLLHVARVIWHITEAFWCKGIPQGDLFIPIVIDRIKILSSRYLPQQGCWVYWNQFLSISPSVFPSLNNRRFPDHYFIWFDDIWARLFKNPFRVNIWDEWKCQHHCSLYHPNSHGAKHFSTDM